MSVKVKRRDFLKIAGASVGAAAVTSSLYSPTAMAHPALPTLNTPISAADRSKTWHLLNRISFGPRPGQVEAVDQMGTDAFLAQQLNPAAINDGATDQRLAKYNTLNMSAAEIHALKDAGGTYDQLVESTLIRGIYSERQLFEVMVLFWSEHFSILQGKSECYILKTIDDRDVIRKNALGKFSDLLHASSKSPAMLNYLDQDSSDKSHANENYAREVMELHTLGVGNYTEKDIKELARCLTGWTWKYYDAKDGGGGEFFFNPGMHDDTAKTVLGLQIPAGGGIKDAETVLDMLAAHPATAKRISLKLCRRFIGDTPSDALVNQVATVFQQTGGDIPSLLKTIFASQDFWSAPPKYKRPHEYLLSVFRAFNIQALGNWGGLVYDVSILGQRPFGHPTPDGYSDISTAWTGASLMDRWNRGIGYTWEKANNGGDEDLFKLAEKNGAPATADGVLNFYAMYMLGRALSAQEQSIIMDFVAKTGKADLVAGRDSIVNAIALLATSPAFQYR